MEITLSDEGLNRYGTRILTAGIKIDSFKKNPVMFYNHDRSKLPIGRWENIKKVEGKLIATADFDAGDEFAKEVKRKLQDGYLNSASVGILVLATSNDPEIMLPGQSYGTITKCELLEVSIVDVPANGNAVKLYQKNAQGELLELSFNDLKNFITEDSMNVTEKTEALAGEVKALQEGFKQVTATLAEISKKIDSLQASFTQADEQKKLILKAEDIIELMEKRKTQKDKLLEKLAAHPERKYTDWWFLDNSFLQELKAKHPEKYTELEKG
jgi:HK97 family phage prohead protease